MLLLCNQNPKRKSITFFLFLCVNIRRNKKKTYNNWAFNSNRAFTIKSLFSIWLDGIIVYDSIQWKSSHLQLRLNFMTSIILNSAPINWDQSTKMCLFDNTFLCMSFSWYNFSYQIFKCMAEPSKKKPAKGICFICRQKWNLIKINWYSFECSGMNGLGYKRLIS